MPRKLFGVTYPEKGDLKTIGKKRYRALITSGIRDVAEREVAKYKTTPTKVTSKKVGDVKFYTAWVKL